MLQGTKNVPDRSVWHLEHRLWYCK